MGSKYAQQVIEMYEHLQSQIFDLLINFLKNSHYEDVNADNILEWQLQQLAKAGLLTAQTIELVARVNKIVPDLIQNMCSQLGIDTVKMTQSEINRYTKHSGKLQPDTQKIIDAYAKQTWQSLFNNVNETLLTRNIHSNATARIYRDIVTKSTLEITLGLKTPEKAIRDNIYRWVDAGIPTRLTDKAGHNWSLEGYARTVINSTNNSVVNELRVKTMNINNVTTSKMSWHMCARPACAPIQGHIVNMVPRLDPNYNPKYDTIYDHGYGEKSGTLGINCHHQFTPWDPDVNIEHPDPDMPSSDEAVKMGDVQQKQRARERAIRQTKKKINAAQQLGDDQTVSNAKSTLANQQKRMREMIKDNDFLTRDYAREQIQSK